MGGVIGRVVESYNDSDDDDLGLAVEMQAAQQGQAGDAAIQMPNEAAVVPAAGSPLLYGGNIFPSQDPSDAVQDVMLPLLRRLASNTPVLTHTKTVNCPFNVNKASIKLIPRRTSADSPPSSTLFDLQFILDATEPCVVKVFYCVDESFSNETYDYFDATDGAKLGAIPTSPAAANAATSDLLVPQLRYIERKLAAGLGQTFFTLGEEALDLTKYALTNLTWNQIEEQLEVDRLRAQREEEEAAESNPHQGDEPGADDARENNAADSSVDLEAPVMPTRVSALDLAGEALNLQEAEDSENAGGATQPSETVENSESSAEPSTSQRRRRSSRRKKKKLLPAAPRPKKLEDLPLVVRNLFPIVISVEPDSPSEKPLVQAQITHVCLTVSPTTKEEPSAASSSAAVSVNRVDSKVLRQKLLVNGAPYNVYDIFGAEEDVSAGADPSLIDGGLQATCVICMSEPRTTLVIPCRHMCLCESCAETLKVQSVKCPICRGPVRSLLKIQVDEDDENKDKAQSNAVDEPLLPRRNDPLRRVPSHPDDLDAEEDDIPLQRIRQVSDDEDDDDDDYTVHTSLVSAAK